MNKVCISGTVNERPKNLGQSGKTAIMFLEGSIRSWDTNAREMYNKKAVFEVICFGNCLKTLKGEVTYGDYVTVDGHVDVRVNDTDRGTFRNMQIVADEITVVGTIEGSRGGGFDQSDNVDEPPPRDNWGGGKSQKRDDWDDIPF